MLSDPRGIPLTEPCIVSYGNPAVTVTDQVERLNNFLMSEGVSEGMRECGRLVMQKERRPRQRTLNKCNSLIFFSIYLSCICYDL